MQLSIFGPRGCGKTTYLTCLYGQGGKPGVFAVLARDEDTRSYLGDRWNCLRRGEVFVGNPLAITELHLTFVAKKKQYEINLKDFAGALVNTKKISDENEIKKQLKEMLFGSFKESEAVMIFIDAPALKDEEAFDRRQEIEALLEVLKSQNSRSLIARPIAIVITKWDCVLADYGNEATAGERFIKEQFPQLSAIMGEVSKNCSIFTVSALGVGALTNNRIDTHKLCPFNLELPFQWIAENIDKVAFENAVEFERQHVKDYALAIANWYEFIKRIDTGPYYEEALQRIKNLKQQKRKQSMLLGVGVGLIFLIIAVASSYSYERAKLQEVIQKLDAKNIKNTEEAVQAIQAGQTYITQWHFVFHWTDKVQKQVEQLQKDTKKNAYMALEIIYSKKNASSSIQDLEEHIAKCSDFISAYPNSEYLSQVTGWEEQDKIALRAKYAQRDFQLILSAIPENFNTLDECNQWRAKAQEKIKLYPEFNDYIAQVQKKMQALETRFQYLTKASVDEKFKTHLKTYPDIDDIPKIKEWITSATSLIQQYPNASGCDNMWNKIESAQTQIKIIEQRSIDAGYQDLLACYPKMNEKNSPTIVKTLETWIIQARQRMDKYPKSVKITEVTNKVHEAEQMINRITSEQKLEILMQKLAIQKSALPHEQAVQQIRIVQNFLEENPNFFYQKKLEDYILQKDLEVFQLAAAKVQTGKTLKEKVELYWFYLRHNQELTKYDEQISKVLDVTESSYYNHIKNINNDLSNLDAKRMHDIATKAQEYLDAGFTQHANQLQQWLSFYEHCVKGMQIYVTISGAKLNKGGRLFSGVTNPDIEIDLSYGLSSISTGCHEDCGWSPSFSSSGYFTWSLDSTSCLKVIITCYDWSNANESASYDSFLPKYLNTEISCQGHTVSVTSTFRWHTLP